MSVCAHTFFSRHKASMILRTYSTSLSWQALAGRRKGQNRGGKSTRPLGRTKTIVNPTEHRSHTAAQHSGPHYAAPPERGKKAKPNGIDAHTHTPHTHTLRHTHTHTHTHTLDDDDDDVLLKLKPMNFFFIWKYAS